MARALQGMLAPSSNLRLSSNTAIITAMRSQAVLGINIGARTRYRTYTALPRINCEVADHNQRFTDLQQMCRLIGRDRVDWRRCRRDWRSVDCAEHSQTRVGEEGEGTAADEQGTVEVDNANSTEPRNPGELQRAGVEWGVEQVGRAGQGGDVAA